jgi:hypothetical protein
MNPMTFVGIGEVIHAVEAFMRYMPSHKESGWK